MGLVYRGNNTWESRLSQTQDKNRKTPNLGVLNSSGHRYGLGKYLHRETWGENPKFEMLGYVAAKRLPLI
jgi:hypothetical protein